MKKLLVFLFFGLIVIGMGFTEGHLILVDENIEEDTYYNTKNKLEYKCIKDDCPYKELYSWASWSLSKFSHHEGRAYDAENSDYKYNYSSEYEKGIMQPAVDLLVKNDKYSLVYIIVNNCSHLYFIYRNPSNMSSIHIQLDEIY